MLNQTVKLFNKMRCDIQTSIQELPDFIIDLNYRDINTINPKEISNLIRQKLKNFPLCYKPQEIEKTLQCEEKIFEENKEKIIPKTCFIILPIGIPGMGKTFLSATLQKIAKNKGFNYYQISSDSIREEAMKVYKKNNLGADHETQFKKTANSAKKSYYRQLLEKIYENKEKMVIFCDKNHPPHGLVSFFKKIEEVRPFVKIIGLSPKCENFIEFSDENHQFHYEMSLNFLITCMVRVINRDHHQTLNGSKTKQLAVTLAMFNLFKNYNFQSCLSLGVDFLIKIPFVDENYRIGNKYVRDLIFDKLRTLKFDIEFKHNQLEEIVDQLSYVKRNEGFCNERIMTDEIFNILDTEFLNKNIENELNESFSKRLIIDDKTDEFKPLSANAEEFIRSESVKKLNNTGISEETKIEPKKQAYNSKKAKTKLPTYLGIDVYESLSTTIIDIILEALTGLNALYDENFIAKDIEEIMKIKKNNPSSSNST